MSRHNSSRNEYERMMSQFQPAIANRDRMVAEYCGAPRERELEEQPAAKKDGLVMKLYRLLGAK